MASSGLRGSVRRLNHSMFTDFHPRNASSAVVLVASGFALELLSRCTFVLFGKLSAAESG